MLGFSIQWDRIKGFGEVYTTGHMQNIFLMNYSIKIVNLFLSYHYKIASLEENSKCNVSSFYWVNTIFVLLLAN
jgi:hypothetical protein